jgi:excisionase family DNA binding protein
MLGRPPIRAGRPNVKESQTNMDHPVIEYARWYHSREAAEFLGIATSTLRRWASEGKIEYSRTLGSAQFPGYRRYQGGAILLCWLQMYGYVTEGGVDDGQRAGAFDPAETVPPGNR